MPTIERRFSPKRLTEARRRAGLSREHLAFALRVSGTTIANWEQGRNLPRLSRVHEIARELDCDVTDLFEASDDA